MITKTNEKQVIEDALCEENVVDIMKNVQCGPITYSKVKFSFNILVQSIGISLQKILKFWNFTANFILGPWLTKKSTYMSFLNFNWNFIVFFNNMVKNINPTLKIAQLKILDCKISNKKIYIIF